MARKMRRYEQIMNEYVAFIDIGRNNRNTKKNLGRHVALYYQKGYVVPFTYWIIKCLDTINSKCEMDIILFYSFIVLSV